MQEKKNGKPQLIVHASRLCTAAEKKKIFYRRTQDARGNIYCLEHGRDVIQGSAIRVSTDHTAIQNNFNIKNLRGRLARWFITLKNYDVKFEYIPGRKIQQ